MASKLSQLRNGIPPHKYIDIRGMRIAVVLIPSDILRQCEELTEEYGNNNKTKVNERVKSQYFDELLAYNCMRDPDDLNKKIAESVEEVREILDIEDIGRVTSAYGELLMNKAPKIELLNEEQLDEIKKHLEVTPLKDLSTVSVVHLANFHQVIVSNS